MSQASVNAHGATLGFERELWAAVDALLPRLIRGEIQVRAAEQFLKERGL